jgi:pyroglutamyl-peptidase
MSKDKKVFLVTGFTPFGKRDINSSWQTVKRLPESTEHAEIHILEVPVTFNSAAKEVKEQAEKLQADAILCVGEAGNRTCINPETTAKNIQNARIPDNAGRQPRDTKIDENLPDILTSALDTQTMLQALEKAGIEGKLSHDAGEYVCNDLYFQTLAYASKPAGFIHIPVDCDPKEYSNGLAVIIDALAQNL